MASTIDFTTLNDEELLYGYQRVNRLRFPENFVACAHEIAHRGLVTPEKFEIDAIGGDVALSAFQKLGDGLATIANAVAKKFPSPQA